MHMHNFPSNALSLIQELKHERVAMKTILFFLCNLLMKNICTYIIQNTQSWFTGAMD